MAPESFHRFPFLPFEIRRMIYLLASPPRFVYVQEEHEDRDDFEERFRTTPVQLELHPSIAYFARNWRDHIPWPFRTYARYQWHHQTTLEVYGFNGPRTKHQPWESTREVPGIPHHFVSECPGVAWEFVRSGFFYSAAPIPIMLHVARESRQVLLDSGYELAFRTRTHGPRIWFNFKKDILYIDRTYHDDQDLHNLLSGNSYWDIGQYQPADLKRVRRIALGKAGRRLGWFFDQTVHDMSNILQLFTGVEELFIDEQSPRQLIERFSRHKNLGGDQLWSHTPVLEVDVLSCLIEDECRVDSTGYYNYDLKVYKENNMGDGSRYFVDTARRFEEELVKRRDDLVHVESIAPWKVPKVNIVYIGYPWVLRPLFDWRWDMWNRFQRLKEEEARSKAAEEACRSISVPSKLIYDQDDINNLPPSPFTEKYQDDLEVYEEAYRMAYEEYAYESPREQHRWLMQATVAAPNHETQ